MDDADRPAPLAEAGLRGARVLVLDDRRLQAELFAGALAVGGEFDARPLHEPARLGEVCEAWRPDVLLVDYVTLTRHLGPSPLVAPRAGYEGPKLVVATHSRDDDTLRACLLAGAMGYVTKGQSTAELVRTIAAVAADNITFTPEELLSLLMPRPPAPTPERVADPSQHPPPVGAVMPLRPREVEVLQALATGRTTAEVAEQLSISVHTVRTHLRSAMGKLGTHSKYQAILAAVRRGLIRLSE